MAEPMEVDDPEANPFGGPLIADGPPPAALRRLHDKIERQTSNMWNPSLRSALDPSAPDPMDVQQMATEPMDESPPDFGGPSVPFDGPFGDSEIAKGTVGAAQWARKALESMRARAAASASAADAGERAAADLERQTREAEQRADRALLRAAMAEEDQDAEPAPLQLEEAAADVEDDALDVAAWARRDFVPGAAAGDGSGDAGADLVLLPVQAPELDIRPPSAEAPIDSPAYESQFVNLEMAGGAAAQEVWMYYVEGLHLLRDCKWTQQTPPEDGSVYTYMASGVRVSNQSDMRVFAERINDIRYIEDLTMGPDGTRPRVDTGPLKRDPVDNEIMWHIFFESTANAAVQERLTARTLGKGVSGRNFFRTLQWTTRDIHKLLYHEFDTDGPVFQPFEGVGDSNKIYGMRWWIEPARLSKPRYMQRMGRPMPPPEFRGGAFRIKRDASGRPLRDEKDPNRYQYEPRPKQRGMTLYNAATGRNEPQKYVRLYNYLTGKWERQRRPDGSFETMPANVRAARNLVTRRVHFAVASIRLNSNHSAWQYSSELRNIGVFDTPTMSLYMSDESAKRNVPNATNAPQRLDTAVPLLTPRSINMDMLIWKGGLDTAVSTRHIDTANPYNKMDWVPEYAPLPDDARSLAVRRDPFAESMPKPMYLRKLSDLEARNSKDPAKADVRFYEVPNRIDKKPTVKQGNNFVRDYSQVWSETMARPLDPCDPTVQTFPRKGSAPHHTEKTPRYMYIHLDKNSLHKDQRLYHRYPSKPTFPKVTMVHPNSISSHVTAIRNSKPTVEALFADDGPPSKDRDYPWSFLVEYVWDRLDPAPEGRLKDAVKAYDPGKSRSERKLPPGFDKPARGATAADRAGYDARVAAFHDTVNGTAQAVVRELRDDPKTQILVVSDIGTAVRRYVFDHRRALTYRSLAAPWKAGNPEFLEGTLDTWYHLNGPGGLYMEARVDEGTEVGRGGYDSPYAVPDASGVRNIDLMKVRGLHEMKATPDQAALPGAFERSRFGPPAWFVTERHHQDSDSTLAARQADLRATMDRMEGIGDWRHKVDSDALWRQSGGESDRLALLTSNPGAETALWQEGATVTPADLRSAGLSQGELPHTRDLEDAPELLPAGRLESGMATTLRQRLYQTQGPSYLRGGGNGTMDLTPTMQWNEDAECFSGVLEVSPRVTGRPVGKLVPNRTALVTVLYVTALDHDDLWFAQRRIDEKWEEFFGILVALRVGTGGTGRLYESFLSDYDKYEVVREDGRPDRLERSEDYDQLHANTLGKGTHATHDAPRTVEEMVLHCYTCAHLRMSRDAMIKQLAPHYEEDAAAMVPVVDAMLLAELAGDDEGVRHLERVHALPALDKKERLAKFVQLRTLLTSGPGEMRRLAERRKQLPAWRCMVDASTSERFPTCVRRPGRDPASFLEHRKRFGGLDGDRKGFKEFVMEWCAMYDAMTTREVDLARYLQEEALVRVESRRVKGASFRLTWLSQYLEAVLQTSKTLEPLFPPRTDPVADHLSTQLLQVVVLRDLLLELLAFRKGVAAIREVAERVKPDTAAAQGLALLPLEDRNEHYPLLASLSVSPLLWPTADKIDRNQTLEQLERTLVPILSTLAASALERYGPTTVSGEMAATLQVRQQQLAAAAAPDEPPAEHLLDDRHLEGTLAMLNTIGSAMAGALRTGQLSERNPQLLTAAADALGMLLIDQRSMEERQKPHMNDLETILKGVWPEQAETYWYVDQLKVMDALLRDVRAEEWKFNPVMPSRVTDNGTRRIMTHIMSTYLIASRVAMGEREPQAATSVSAAQSVQAPSRKRRVDESSAPGASGLDASGFRSLGMTDQLAIILRQAPNQTQIPKRYNELMNKMMAMIGIVGERERERMPPTIQELLKQLIDRYHLLQPERERQPTDGIPEQLHAVPRAPEAAEGVQEHGPRRREVVRARAAGHHRGTGELDPRQPEDPVCVDGASGEAPAGVQGAPGPGGPHR